MTRTDTDSPTLVSADWLTDNLDRFRSEDADYRLLEVSIDPEQYENEHIPGASNVPWSRAVDPETHLFRDADELRAIYLEEQGLEPAGKTVAYCRIGERSSHSWFVLSYLLGFDDVRNYDGSWTEWGNLVGAPIER